MKRKQGLSNPTFISLIFGIFGMLIIFWGWHFLPFPKTIQGTDEAFIEAEHLVLNAGIDGKINAIYVTDYQEVKKGQKLFTLDCSLDLAKRNFLEKKQAYLLEKLQIFKQKKNSDAPEKEKILQAQLEAIKAQCKFLELKCKEKDILAPINGYLGKIKVSKGQYVTKTIELVPIIGKKIWAIAHYKEVQFPTLAKGQKVFLTVHAVPKKAFEAKIIGLSPATDNIFAPFEGNGNSAMLIKTPKFLTVKMAIDPSQKGFSQLRAGMSAFASAPVKDTVSLR